MGNCKTCKDYLRSIVGECGEDKLKQIYDELPDVVDYKGREYKKYYYSLTEWPTGKYPHRSKEIIWEDEKGNQLYLFMDYIEDIGCGCTWKSYL